MNSTMDRRDFIRTCAGGTLGGALMHAAPAIPRPELPLVAGASVAADDEEFWAVVREQFPLAHDPVYMNNGTMGPSPYAVMEAVRGEMEAVNRTGRYGGWEEVRARVAAFINATPEEISLTHNVTEGINVVACGAPLQRGDEVLLTNHEHAGNALPWLARARRDGIVVTPVPVDSTAAGTLNRISDAIGKRTRMIAVPHVTCTIGQVLPGKAISRLGHDKGLLVMLDAAHTPGMLPLNVQDLECDFLATCGHKWMMGPKGTGFLYVRKEKMEVLEPFWAGGGSDAGWDLARGTLSFRKDAHRFDFASQSAPLSVGLGASIDFLTDLGMQNVSFRGRKLADLLRTELLALGDRAEILTPAEDESRASIVGFRLKNVPFDRLQKLLLDEHRIITRMVPENGINCNRISTHIYNSPDEVRRLGEILRSVA